MEHFWQLARTEANRSKQPPKDMLRFMAVAALLLPVALFTPQAKAQYYNPYTQQ
jgi:hypothetical protein